MMDVGRHADHQSNRLIGKWTCSRKSKVCKEIQASTKCFCDHDFKSHLTTSANPNKVLCTVPSCSCPHFSYVPSQGNLSFKCSCGHSHKLHDPISRRCTFLNCGACNRGFHTSFICATCAVPFMEHTLVFEPKYPQSESANNDIAAQAQIDHLKLQQMNSRLQEQLWQTEGIDDAEIQRRKSQPKQQHFYENYSNGSTSQLNNSFQDSSIRIKEQWNPATISIEENGIPIDLQTHKRNQRINDELRAQANSKFDQHVAEKAKSRQDLLKRVNVFAKIEHEKLTQKYGITPYDDDEEYNEIIQENYRESQEQPLVSALKLFYTPNKYAIKNNHSYLKNLILLEVEKHTISKH